MDTSLLEMVVVSLPVYYDVRINTNEHTMVTQEYTKKWRDHKHKTKSSGRCLLFIILMEVYTGNYTTYIAVYYTYKRSCL